MKYFLAEPERKASGSTCYFEFQKGAYRGKHWRKDSLCLPANKFDAFGLHDLFSGSIADFDYFGPTEVTKEQWETLASVAIQEEVWQEVLRELTPWVEECFQTHKIFTILGI